jgi:hypothetical protein
MAGILFLKGLYLERQLNKLDVSREDRSLLDLDIVKKSYNFPDIRKKG